MNSFIVFELLACAVHQELQEQEAPSLRKTIWKVLHGL